jgi:hypothetical protein
MDSKKHSAIWFIHTQEIVKMASTKEMQARAKARKTSKFPNPGSAMIDKSVTNWFNNLCNVMEKVSPWKMGYTMPDSAIPYLKGLMQRQADNSTKEDCQALLKGLLDYREFSEKAICYKLQKDADKIRENSTPSIEYRLGMLDAVIGFALREFGNVNVIHINMNKMLENA